MYMYLLKYYYCFYISSRQIVEVWYDQWLNHNNKHNVYIYQYTSLLSYICISCDEGHLLFNTFITSTSLLQTIEPHCLM